MPEPRVDDVHDEQIERIKLSAGFVGSMIIIISVIASLIAILIVASVLFIALARQAIPDV